MEKKMKHGRPTWGRFRLQICIKQIKHPFLRIQIEQIKHPFLRIQEAVTGRDDDHQRWNTPGFQAAFIFLWVLTPGFWL
jgi:hypothetical protein